MAAADRMPDAQKAAPGGDSAQLELSERLIRDARAGDAAALSELIGTWRTYLLHVAENETPAELKQKVGASDLVQSACLDIHQHFEDFRGATVAEWRVWLRRMLVRDVQDARRRFLGTEKRAAWRERRLQDSTGLRYDLSDQEGTPSAALMAQEESAVLRDALQRLSEEYRQVLQLRNWECLAFAEIGRRMQRSEEAARKLWSRAVIRLQEEMTRVTR